MRILHRIHVGKRHLLLVDALLRIGIRWDSEEGSGPIYFDIAEDDPRWQEVATLVKEHASGGYLADRVWTEFTQEERDSASVLTLGACWTHGYPEPSDVHPVPGTRVLPYITSTYDLSEFCPICGCGARQKALFRMKKEPAWGRRSLLKLNWVDDELFVQKDIWEAIFRPFDVDCEPVLKKTASTEMKSAVQLKIQPIARLKVEGLPNSVCERCGRNKYLPICRGFHPSAMEYGGQLAKSKQYFGR